MPEEEVEEADWLDLINDLARGMVWGLVLAGHSILAFGDGLICIAWHHLMSAAAASNTTADPVLTSCPLAGLQLSLMLPVSFPKHANLKYGSTLVLPCHRKRGAQHMQRPPGARQGLQSGPPRSVGNMLKRQGSGGGRGGYQPLRASSPPRDGGPPSSSNSKFPSLGRRVSPGVEHRRPPQRERPKQTIAPGQVGHAAAARAR